MHRESTVIYTSSSKKDVKKEKKTRLKSDLHVLILRTQNVTVMSQHGKKKCAPWGTLIRVYTSFQICDPYKDESYYIGLVI